MAIGPGRIVIRADAPMALLEPRTWTAEGERLLQFFHRSITEEEIRHDPEHPEAILLMEGERWSEEWEERAGPVPPQRRERPEEQGRGPEEGPPGPGTEDQE
ncbi:MAG: hypothetical protein R6W82_03010 [bacterium]